MSSISSMTGFASAQGLSPIGSIVVELKCVNSRFLDLTLKLPDELRSIESMVRETITKRLSRGKLECRMSLKKIPEKEGELINKEALDMLRSMQEEVLKALPQTQPLRMIDILEYPGIVNDSAVDFDELTRSIRVILDSALDTFIASRQREGMALGQLLLNYCDEITATVADVRQRIPDILALLEKKLTERLTTALSDRLQKGSPLATEEITERIRQEVTLYALRLDVDEEMNRLDTHVAEVRRIIAAGGPAGRRLDFLMQEMNREANTLGSKATAIEMTNASLALKVTIEQMREQIQNIE